MAKIYYENELVHYGVLGMKWGVRKAHRKLARNEKLERKTLDYKKRAAAMTVKAEKAHKKYDLEGSNRQSIKAAKLAKKGDKLAIKAWEHRDNPMKSMMLDKKSADLYYKSAKAKLKGDKISKTTGYGHESMKYINKANKLEVKAEKAQRDVVKNNVYVMAMRSKVNVAISDDGKIKSGYEFVESFLNEYDRM